MGRTVVGADGHRLGHAVAPMARLAGRSQGSTLRCLIREEARRCGLWPAGRYPLLLADYHRDQVEREVHLRDWSSSVPYSLLEGKPDRTQDV